MSRLTELIKYKKTQGGSITGSIAGGIKERLKEKFDPRQLINQKGLLVSLFPGLKTYQSKTYSPRVAGKKIEQSSIDFSSIQPIFESIQYDTKLSAKNLSVLPSLHRDFNVIRQNIIKLLKLETMDASTKADMFFRAAAKREEMYESQLSKIRDSQEKSPQKISNKLSKGSMIDILVLGGLLGLTVLAIKEISDAVDKVRTIDMKESVDTLSNYLKTSLNDFFLKMKTNEIDESDIENQLSKLTFSQLTDVQKLALLEKQGELEGKEMGSLPGRLNNPGAMIYAPWQKKYGGEPTEGVKGPDGKTRSFTKFPTLEKGREAQRALWESESYRNKPLNEALKKWVDPHNKEAFRNYMRGIAKSIGLDITKTTPQTSEEKPSVSPTKELSPSRMPIEQGTLSSHFGMRTMKSLKTGKDVTRMHYGVDIMSPEGKDVFASESGEVVFADIMGGYGQTVEIKHDDGTYSLYAHVKELLVKKGDKVKRGQTIAKSGGKVGTWYSGSSRGEHLHFELKDKNRNPIDPTKVIPELMGERGVRKVKRDPSKYLSPISSNRANIIDSTSFDVAMGTLSGKVPVFIAKNTIQKNIIISNNQSTTKDYLPFLFQRSIT